MDQLCKFAYCNLSNNRGCNFFLHGAILSGVKSKPGLFWFYPTLPVTSPEKLRHPLKQLDAKLKIIATRPFDSVMRFHYESSLADDAVNLFSDWSL